MLENGRLSHEFSSNLENLGKSSDFSTIEVAFFHGDFGLKHESKQILQHFCSSKLQTSTE